MGEQIKEVEEQQEQVEEIIAGNLSSEDLDRIERGEDITPEEDKEEDKEEEKEEEKEEKTDKKDEDNKDDKEEKEGENPEADSEGNIKLKQEDYDKLKKRIDDKDDHIKKIEEDNFNLREKKRQNVKDLEDQVEALKKKNSEAYLEDEKEAANTKIDLATAEDNLTQARKEETQAANKTIVSTYAPEFEDHKTEIQEMLKSDGADEKVVEMFNENPYGFDPGTVVNLVKRVQLSKDLTESNDKVTKLEAEIVELKKKPGSLLREIEKQTHKGRKLTGNSGGGGGEDDDNATSLYSKSSADLEKIERGN